MTNERKWSSDFSFIKASHLCDNQSFQPLKTIETIAITEAFQLVTRPHRSSSLTSLTHLLQTSWMDCRFSSACRHRPHRGSTALQQKGKKNPPTMKPKHWQQ